MRATLSLTERRDLAAKDRDGFRRFLNSRERWESGNLKSSGSELTIRLADGPLQSRANQRALSAQLETAGAYLIPETFADWFEESLLYASPLRDWGTTVATERGGAWRLPTVNDTEVEGVIVPENALPSIFDASITQFGSITLYAQKFASGWMLVPNELMEDAPGLVEKRLAGAIGRRIGRLQNSMWTPKILGEATLGVTTASATAIAGDELKDLFFSVDPAYRERPNCCWQMNNSTLLYVRQLKDSTGRYLFQQREKPDDPDLLMGKPVAVNRDLPSIAAGNITVLFGDFSKVVMRDVGRDVRLVVTSERFAEFDQTAVVGFQRSEAVLADAGTHPIASLQQA